MCSFPTNATIEASERLRLQIYETYWNQSALDAVKKRITRRHRAPSLSPQGNNDYNAEAMGRWDAYRRMTMLEPLAADVFTNGVVGDFVDAGVFRGATTLYMGHLMQEANQTSTRTLWMADLFGAGMRDDAATRQWMKLHNIDQRSLEMQGKNWSGLFRADELSEPVVRRNILRHLNASIDLRSVRGSFETSLPGGIGKIAILRIDVDEFAATYDALDKLYPLISRGGYVVFDDWKVWQAQQAILHYRNQHNIRTTMFRTRRDWPPPLQSIDCMVFWKK